jgi:hypothetical protein
MTMRSFDGERITVTLIPQVHYELDQLHARTKLSRTDIANRAITLYDFFDKQVRAGRDLFAWDHETGATEWVLVQLLDPPDGQAPQEGSARSGRSLPHHHHSHRLAGSRRSISSLLRNNRSPRFA